MIKSFIPVIDQLSMSLSDKISAYDTVNDRFGFLSQIDKLHPDELSQAATKLFNLYKNNKFKPC